MAKVTIKKASELTGKHKRTIQRYVLSGKLSYTTNSQGFKVIDTSELIRVFGELSHPVSHKMRPVDQWANSDTITLTSEQLKAIVKEAVSEAIKEVAPLLLEQKKDTPRSKASTHVQVMPDHKNDVVPGATNEVAAKDDFDVSDYLNDMTFIK